MDAAIEVIRETVALWRSGKITHESAMQAVASVSEGLQ